MNFDMKCKTIEDAYWQVQVEEKRCAAVVRENIRIGDMISYKHGDYRINAEVLDYGLRAKRLLVRGKTGKIYWITTSLLFL